MTKDEMIEALIGFFKERKKERLMEHLQEEKAIDMNRWYEKGEIDGRRDAYGFCYSQFIRAEEVQVLRKDKKPDTFGYVLDLEADAVLRHLRERSPQFEGGTAYISDYIIGWSNGVIEVWDQVKDKVQQ